MVEVSLFAVGMLILLLTIGVPLPFCFGGVLMIMTYVGDISMKGNMMWGVGQ
jgi:hypothetical protein